MRLFGLIFLGGLTVLLGAQIYSSLTRQGEVSREFQELEAKLEEAERGQAELRSELEFYSNPENLEKELRARFNYKKPGEKTIIIVPKSQSSTKPSL